MKITYESVNHNLTRVLLDGRLVGEIRRVSSDKYQYHPKGSSVKGEIFSSLGECKRSLETPEE